MSENSLETKINFYKGRISEFVDNVSLKSLESNAFRKSLCLCPMLKIKTRERDFLQKVIFLYDLIKLYKCCFYDNKKRSENDNEYIIKFSGIPEEIKLNFPKRDDRFFRNGLSNLIYGVSHIQFRDAEKEMKNGLKFYKEAYEFWSKEIAQGA